MSKSKELLKWLFVSIGVFCLSFVFLYIWNKIDKENYYFPNFYDLENVSDTGSNAYLDIYGYNSQLIYVMDDDLEYSYYIYLDEMKRAVLVKIDDEQAESCEKHGYSQYINCYIEGGVFPLDEELKKEIMVNLESSSYYNYVKDIGLNSLYLDAELTIYKDSDIYQMLFLITFGGGIIGIIASLILLLKENLEKIKQSKHKIWKWLFRLSFLPYGIILMISIYLGLIEGFEEFLICLLVLCVICTFIPIIPIALIYQIVYAILNFKGKNKK